MRAGAFCPVRIRCKVQKIVSHQLVDIPTLPKGICTTPFHSGAQNACELNPLILTDMLQSVCFQVI
jgi:hypothetical protein